MGEYGIMRKLCWLCGCFVILATVCSNPFLTLAEEQVTPPRKSAQTGTTAKASGSQLDDLEGILSTEDKVEAAVIHPYRTANVGAEVSGVIAAVKYEEGQRIPRNETVYELDKNRYAIELEKAEAKRKAAEQALERARQDLKIQEELLPLGSTTMQDRLKAQAEVIISEQRLKAARDECKLAALNVRACSVKAPFTGYLAVRYKEPYETVERLAKLFAIVDASKVYAVANVPEKLVPKFKLESKAVFEHATGKKYTGTVAKISALTDPKSRTRKVYVLVDNPTGDLQIGTTGSIGLED